MNKKDSDKHEKDVLEYCGEYEKNHKPSRFFLSDLEEHSDDQYSGIPNKYRYHRDPNGSKCMFYQLFSNDFNILR